MGFQLAGMALMLAFYACYFGKMLRQRRRGIQTDQMGKGKTGAARAIEVIMKLASLGAPLAELVSILLVEPQTPPAVRIAGLCLGGLGVFIFMLSVFHMGDSWRAGVSADTTALITGGIYQFSRNPAFLGFDLLYVGLLAAFFNWPLLAASLFPILMFHLQIVKVEEPHLQQVFGSDYQTYRRTVRRYWGRREKPRP